MQFDADDALIEPSSNPTAEFDATATPTTGPPPSSTPPEAVQEPLGESGEEQQAEPAEKPPFMEPETFDQRHVEPFHGLIYLGRLIQDHTVWGHSFTLCTPSHRERLQIGQVIKPYMGTSAEDPAWMACLVSAYVIEIDGEPLPEPVVKNKNTALYDRFTWLIDNVHTPVINELFEKCLEMDKQVREILTAMGKV